MGWSFLACDFSVLMDLYLGHTCRIEDGRG